MLQIDDIVSEIPAIDPEARYWFFRTEGGKLFAHFIASNSISIGYPRIHLTALKELKGDKIRDAVRALVGKHYPEKKSSGFAVSQLITFQREMKKGDFVLIPSFATARIAVGVITDDEAYEAKDGKTLADYPDFTKRRAVRWLNQYPRDQFNPKMWRVLHTHQTIVNATEFAPYIDAQIFDLFKKGDNYHYSVRVKKEDHINARNLFEAFADLLLIADKFSDSEGMGESTDKIEVRVNLNSPGDIELIATTAQLLGTLALIVVFLNGGGLKFKVQKMGINLDLSTEGIIKKISDFLNAAENRKIAESVRRKIEGLSIADSNQIKDLLETVAVDQKPKKGKKQ